jgi:ATP-dependent RNA helicase RhlE
VGQHLKTPLLMQLLKHTDTESVLIFTRTKHRARRVGDQLQKAGFKAISMQGNLSQNRRQEAMDGFRSGKYQIMVATDIAARGIDVSSISHVVNFDIPETVEAYTHRIGRTGRAARTGDAYTLVTTEDYDQVRAIERVLKVTIERRKVEGFDYTVAPQAKHRDEFARPPLPPRGPRRPHPLPAHLDHPHPHGREFPSAGAGQAPQHGHGTPRPHGQASSMHPRPHGSGPSRPQSFGGGRSFGGQRSGSRSGSGR